LRRFWTTKGKASTRKIGETIFWFSGRVSPLQKLHGKEIPPCGNLKRKSRSIWLPSRRGHRLQVVWVVCHNRDTATIVAARGCLAPLLATMLRHEGGMLWARLRLL